VNGSGRRRDLICHSARGEFEAARFETDPEVVSFLLVFHKQILDLPREILKLILDVRGLRHSKNWE
jgi:hypothetical protein